MNDIIWLTMRRLRTPLIVLLLVYFASVSLLIAIPGEDASGQPVRLGYLDAAYFVAILSTTIGLGEVPNPFTGAQRLAVFFIIFPNVIAWLYAIGVILGLFLDEKFKEMLARNRFVRRVRWIREPYFLVCGFGNTGRMLGSGLLERGLQIIVVESSEDVLLRRRLEDRFAQAPMLAGDTKDREIMELAGLQNPYCQGVIAVTNDDKANLTIAITSKLLRPDLPVFARSQTDRVSDNMRSFDTDNVVDPYEIFAKRLYMALQSPIKHQVQDWLLSVPGSDLREPLKPPSGHWVVCGVGRFGARMTEALERAGQTCTAVDVHEDRCARFEQAVVGRGTEADTLREANIEDAVGVIAGTGDDVDNLSILLTARDIKPELFLVARQEDQQNDALFEASQADLVARPSWIVARRILALATTPLLKTFLEYVQHEDDDFANRVKHRLERCLGGHAPNVWLTDLGRDQTHSLEAAKQEGVTLKLDHLVHNTRSGQDEDLRCVCLVLERGGARRFMPGTDTELQSGDRLLFAGRSSARREIERALADPVLLLDYATPYSVPRTAIGRWLARRGEG